MIYHRLPGADQLVIYKFIDFLITIVFLNLRLLVDKIISVVDFTNGDRVESSHARGFIFGINICF